MSARTAAIIGAGIGGLAAGISLQGAGFDVTVYERADEIRPLGAGLSIWPNGNRALHALGLDELSDAAVTVPGGGALRRADGTAFAEFDPQMVAAAPAAEVLLHSLFDREPSDRWVVGNVALLGDAAHPMLPFLGQGGCVALEDAVALGSCLARAEDPARALVDYERSRRSRAEQLVKGSRAAANVALARSSLGRRVRNFAIARIPVSARLRQLDRVVGRS
jgi:2-polyprenyl-6-methoxyphenol hydroxylase-like FAD-dependent oxidoreductase